MSTMFVGTPHPLVKYTIFASYLDSIFLHAVQQCSTELDKPLKRIEKGIIMQAFLALYYKLFHVHSKKME